MTKIHDLARRIAEEYWDMTPDKEIKHVFPTANLFVQSNWKAFTDAARKMLSEQKGEEIIIINGEQIEKAEAMELLRGLYHEAEEAAGEFHGNNRSEKFRENWPDEYTYARANWKSYVVEARKRYAQKLADPRTPPADARKMHMALVLEQELGLNKEKDNRVQIQRNTQQFSGDHFENKKIHDKFGKHQNSLRELFLNTVSPSKRFQ